MSNPEPIFRVGNKHAAGSGLPPHIDGSEKGRYYGYFENEYGEQAIFIYDYEAETGTLYMGEVGWEEPITLTDGIPNDLVLSEARRCCGSAPAGRRQARRGKSPAHAHLRCRNGC